MAFELIYTSVPQGVRTGSSGFCTVAYSRGMAANIVLQLENLSAYKPYFPHYDENASANPPAYFHYITSFSGKTYHILSRVAFYDVDYTGRSNKLAHHLVFSEAETARLDAGPGDILEQDGVFRKIWNEEPKLFDTLPAISQVRTPFSAAISWREYTGDAGYAGVLAQSFLDNPDKPVFIVFDPLVHRDIHLLVAEALKLLPEQLRWQVTFNTYFNTLPAGMSCLWRFCVPDAAALKEARRIPNTLVIDLTKPLPPAPDSLLADCARTGSKPEYASAAVPADGIPLPPTPQEIMAAQHNAGHPGSVVPPPAPGFPPISRDPLGLEKFNLREEKNDAAKMRLMLFGGLILFIILMAAALSGYYFYSIHGKTTAEDTAAPEAPVTAPAATANQKENPESDSAAENTPPEQQKPESDSAAENKPPEPKKPESDSAAENTPPEQQKPESDPAAENKPPEPKKPEIKVSRETLWCYAPWKQFAENGGTVDLTGLLAPGDNPADLKLVITRGPDQHPLAFADGFSYSTTVYTPSPETKELFKITADRENGSFVLTLQKPHEGIKITALQWQGKNICEFNEEISLIPADYEASAQIDSKTRKIKFDDRTQDYLQPIRKNCSIFISGSGEEFPVDADFINLMKEILKSVGYKQPPANIDEAGFKKLLQQQKPRVNNRLTKLQKDCNELKKIINGTIKLEELAKISGDFKNAIGSDANGETTLGKSSKNDDLVLWQAIVRHYCKKNPNSPPGELKKILKNRLDEIQNQITRLEKIRAKLNSAEADFQKENEKFRKVFEGKFNIVIKHNGRTIHSIENVEKK